ncbi:hypothetical protein MOQ_006917, partial [Trypanosoma cruzi marinkellei]
MYFPPRSPGRALCPCRNAAGIVGRTNMRRKRGGDHITAQCWLNGWLSSSNGIAPAFLAAEPWRRDEAFSRKITGVPVSRCSSLREAIVEILSSRSTMDGFLQAPPLVLTKSFRLFSDLKRMENKTLFLPSGPRHSWEAKACRPSSRRSVLRLQSTYSRSVNRLWPQGSVHGFYSIGFYCHRPSGILTGHWGARRCMAVICQKHLDAAANSNSCWPHHFCCPEAVRSNTPKQLFITSLHPLSGSPLAQQFPSGSLT